jgi:Niemann-Pick C2 protein
MLLPSVFTIRPILIMETPGSCTRLCSIHNDNNLFIYYLRNVKCDVGTSWERSGCFNIRADLIVLVTFNFPAFLGCLFPGVTDNSVKAGVHGIIQGLPIPWPLHDPNACHLSGLTCPLQPGNNYHYTATFPVLKSYPKVSSFLQTEYVFMPYQIVADVWKTWRRYLISEIQNS